MQNLANAINGDVSAIWGAVFTTDLETINAGGVIILIEDTTAAGASSSRVYTTSYTTAADCQLVEFASGATPTVDVDYQNSASTAITTDPGAGRFGLRRQMSALATNEIHFTRNDDTQYSWDPDASTWQVLSGPSSIPDATAASGGGIKGKITVDSDYGLAVASGVLSINLDATPGLEFNAGALRALVNPNGGLERVTAGLGVKVVSVDRLSVGASGLDVVGLPSLFEIGGVAVGATVTAPNLDTLTDGSNADSLHTHLPPTSVSEANRVENAITASENIIAGDPVYYSGNDTVGRADASLGSKAKVVGVAVATTGLGSACPVATIGSEVAGVGGGGWTAGQLIWLAAGGGLTNSRPGPGNYLIVCGIAANASDLFVLPQYQGRRAA